MNKNVDFLKGIIIAHRGVHDNKTGAPENSLSAFKNAVESGIPIEFDICMLKDGNIIVFHDDDFNRLTGYNKTVKECSYDEIKDLRLLDTDEHIPLFSEFLNLVNGKVLLDIEIKSGASFKEFCLKICELLDNYKGQFVIKSFDPKIVYWFKKNRPDFIRGQLSYDYKDNKNLNPLIKYMLKNMLFNILTKPDFIAYDINSLPDRKVERLRKKNYPILAWTITSEDEMEKAKNFADSYICDNLLDLQNQQ